MQHKKLSSLAKNCSLPTFKCYETITNLIQYELSQENPIYLKQFYTSLSNQIKIENLKSSLPLKKFSFHLLTSLNLRKLKMRSHLKKRISCILPILISTTTNLLHVYYINIVSSETLEKIKISL